ncbi:MAG TPA: tetratricopeptide repeat protein [Pyrinomonadaceae bacterium]|nr:tetratricopeptide repeat protein [Pyrinomonadaceae bacterium]
MSEAMFDDDDSSAAKYEARQLFQEAYEAQLAQNYESAIELYQRSIETFPTAEAHTFLGWVYSFQNRYDEAIAECLEAIRVDETLGNPYNDIGSYLLAKGDSYGCVRWFKRALFAPRYDSYAFPHFNLGRVYEMRKKYLDAARHYTLALEQQPGFTEAANALRRMQALLN